MRKNYTVDEAFKDLDELDKVEEPKLSWEILDEDDDLYKSLNLNEFLSKAQLNGLDILDIIYCSPEVQHEGELIKHRPMLAIYTSGSFESPKIEGMQVTTVAPKEGKYRTQFRYALEDWQKIGLNEKCYINYDHLVSNVDDDINFGIKDGLLREEPLHITNNDAKKLVATIMEHYNELMRLGYRETRDKNILNYFIKYIGN